MNELTSKQVQKLIKEHREKQQLIDKALVELREYKETEEFLQEMTQNEEMTLQKFIALLFLSIHKDSEEPIGKIRILINEDADMFDKWKTQELEKKIKGEN